MTAAALLCSFPVYSEEPLNEKPDRVEELCTLVSKDREQAVSVDKISRFHHAVPGPAVAPLLSPGYYPHCKRFILYHALRFYD